MTIRNKALWLGTGLLSLGMIAGCSPQDRLASDIVAYDKEATNNASVSSLVESELKPEWLADLDDFSEEDMQNLRRDILRYIGTPIASQPSSCRVVPFGIKPCGGPERYVLYSTENTEAELIEELITHYNQLTEIWNQKNELVSDCAVLPRMTATVINGVCVPVETAEY